jgi:hypothetical protein
LFRQERRLLGSEAPDEHIKAGRIVFVHELPGDQQLSTTTSIGRLMLNVLLSFAQFEREVTGERIRDKITASKKKGMWMGGIHHSATMSKIVDWYRTSVKPRSSGISFSVLSN